MNIKNIIRLTLNLLHLDLTKNLEYDRLTKSIIKKVLTRQSNCVDVGCHKGEILDIMLSAAPEGKHFGFEPIPSLCNNLKKKYEGKATILPYALADEDGISTFHYVKNAPAYSGIKKRKYNVAPNIEEIKVELKRLDEVILEKTKIDLIKIDVEGAEYGVLKGGINLLRKDKPYIIFEFGLGASDYYGTKPEALYNLLTKEAKLNISTLKSFINNNTPLSLTHFSNLYNNNKEYYFIAHP